MVRRFLLIVLVIFAGCPGLFAINIIKNFTVEDGLPSSEVYSVFQDNEGYIWFCTDRGVSIYDGYSFKNYSTDDGLSYNTVFRIIEDPDGNLWFTAFNGTLSYWDKKNKTFVRFKLNDALQKHLGTYNWVHLIDFRGDSLLIYPYRQERVFLSVSGDSSIKELDIYKYPPYEKRRMSPDSSLNNIYVIRSANQSFPYYHTVRRKELLRNQNDIELIEKVFQRYENDLFITDIYSFDDKYYFSAHEGLFLFQGDKLIEHEFKETIISGVWKDNEDNLWITTANNGVFVARLDDIQTYELSPLLENGEKITNITSFKGHLLAGTNRSRVIDFTNGQTLCRIPSTSSIHSFYERNDTLFASYGMIITEKDGKLIAKLNEKLKQRYIIIPTTGNNLFYTSFNSFGFIRGDTFAIKKTGRVLDAHRLKSGSIFYSKFTGLWEIRNNDMEQMIDHTANLGIEHTTVRKIYAIDNKLLVLATSGSGVVIARDGKVITRITTQHGLPSNMINACYIDEKFRRIWCATNRGVSILDYGLDSRGFRIKTVVNLNRSHGIVSNFINAIIVQNDQVLLAGDIDISSVPRNFRLATVNAPNVNILSLISNDHNYLGERNVFSHDENDFEVFFNALSLQRPLDGNFYRYRLRSSESSDMKWTYTNDRGVWFKDLSSGTYVFEVSARSLNSNWSVPERTEFTIKPYFLEVWWVRTGVIITILAFIFFIVRRYFLQLQLESEKAIEIKNLQLKNNSLELAALRGQMNPHFIFNALKSIQNLILTEQKWEANNLLTKFSKLIRSSLEYSRTDFIPLLTEVQFLENYLDIEKSRTPNKFDFEIHMEEVRDAEDIKIPGLLIQPICENAIKHAFQEEKGGHLEIYFELDADEGIIVRVRDNGIGYFNAIPRDASTQHSMGLDIVRSRLALFREQGYDAWLKIEPLDKETKRGTIISFKLPSQ